jgi:hypothetical protein
MPRSIADVNAIRRLHRNPAETGSPGHQPDDGHGDHGFDPNQPRVPAGHSDGGQWTDEPGGDGPAVPRRGVVLDDSGEEAWESVTSTSRPDGTLAEQEVLNRDGSRIHSQFSRDARIAGWDERHTVILPDGQEITFEQSGAVQRTYDADGRPMGAAVWTNDGPEPLAEVQPAFLAAIPPAVATTVELALILGTWLAGRNGPAGIAVVSFPADVYRPPRPEEKPEPVFVGRLTEDELKKACDRYVDVQEFTDGAAAGARRERKDWTPTGFGTEVHKRVAHTVNGDPPKHGPKNPQYPNFMAEFSALKAEAAVKADQQAPPPGYGQKDTIRVDVLENRRDEKTVCVYDIKTGERVLSKARIEEIVGAVYARYQETLRIIITEIRPRR